MRIQKSGQWLGLALIALGGGNAWAQSTDVTVTVVHGIPGTDIQLPAELPVDVEVSGTCALTDFTFGTISDRLTLPAGSYDIRVRLSDGSCGGAVAIEALDVPFLAGENATVVAHLDADGAPTASKFVNDLVAAPPLEGKVQAHHTAAAPAVDIRLVRNGVLETLNGVVNGQSGSIELGAREHELLIAPAGGAPIFQAPVEILDQQTIFAYAVGSLATGSFTVLVDVQEQNAPAAPAAVTVIHGIPGEDLGADPALPVDISAAGVGCLITGLEFTEVLSGLSLPAGSYDLEVRLSDGACGGTVAVSVAGVAFAEGEDATVIAHLDEGGSPVASKFTNDTSEIGGRRARVIAHHTAAAPAVDITLRNLLGHRAVRLEGVTNGQSGGGEVRRGLYILRIAPAGERRSVLRAFAPLPGGDLALVYAVGSLSSGTFQLIVDRRHP